MLKMTPSLYFIELQHAILSPRLFQFIERRVFQSENPFFPFLSYAPSSLWYQNQHKVIHCAALRHHAHFWHVRNSRNMDLGAILHLSAFNHFSFFVFFGIWNEIYYEKNTAILGKIKFCRKILVVKLGPQNVFFIPSPKTAFRLYFATKYDFSTLLYS